MLLLKPEQSFLVTGGTGFLGAKFCARLAREGHRVIVLSRRPERAPRMLVDAKVMLIKELAELRNTHIDVVLNLAGEPLVAGRWSARRKRHFVCSRVETTRQLYRWVQAQEVKPDLLLSGSAVGFYGVWGSEFLTEQQLPRSGFAHQLCAAWEAEAERFTELGVRECRLRTGVVLDLEGGALARMLPAFRWGLGGPLGTGDQWMSWIHREDWWRALAHCINHSTLSGPINFTAPEPVTNRDFSRLLARALSRPALAPMPGWLLRLLFGEMADELLLSGQRVLPSVLQASGFQFEFETLAEALADLLNEKK